jgi:hypothetical protein
VSQSTFVKGRYILDNFKVVQETTKLLHARKRLALLLKVDIAWAFNYVVSHSEISISKCEPFSKRESNFLKDFIYFLFKMILFEFIFNLK